MKKALLIFCLLSNITTFAQIQFKGSITEQNSGNKPIASANIKAEFANPIQSDSKGLFNLTFQGKKLGDEISINAQKEGFEVVNFKEMMTKIQIKQVAPFKIIMCKAGLVAQNRAKYYGISEKYITEKYEKELAKLNRNISGWAEKAAKLEEDFRASLEFAKELAEKYSLMNLDDVTDLQRKAFKLFEENKVDEAIKLLEGENYQENIRKVKIEQKKIQENAQSADDEIAKAEEVIQQQISKLMFQADLYAQDFQFDKAEKTYEIAVEADTSNDENIFEFAYFLQKQNKHDKAILYYLRTLKLSKAKSDVAMAQNNLGILYQAKNDFSKALIFFTKALEIYEGLAKTNPTIYQAYISDIQNNLGLFYQAKNDYPAALSAFSKAMEINLHLTKSNPSYYELAVAKTHNNLSILYRTINDYPAALIASSKALINYESLAQTYPVTYEPFVATIQNNLGVLYSDKNEYEAASYAYSKALVIYEHLSINNPATYDPVMAGILNNLGSLYAQKNEYKAALNAYSKSLEIRVRLSNTNPATYEPSVAKTQLNLGDSFQAIYEYQSALKAYSTALEIYERFAKINKSTFEPNVARTLNSLGILYQAMKEYSSALKSYSNSLEIYERLAKTNSASYEPHVAMAQSNLGSLYRDKNDYPLSMEAYLSALQIRERLFKSNPDIYGLDLAVTNTNLGNLYQAKNEYQSALKAYTTALEIYKILAKSNQTTYEQYVARTQNSLGALYKSQNEYPLALKAFLSALEIYERLAENNPQVYEIDLCRSIVLLSFLQKADYQSARQVQINEYLDKAQQILPKYPNTPVAKALMIDVNDLQNYFKALQSYLEIQVAQKQLEKFVVNSENIKIRKQIIEKYRYLVANNYPQLAVNLGSNLSGLAWHQLFEKQFKEAEQSAREALNPNTFKKTEDYDTQIEWANTNLALALLFQGKYTEAEKIYLSLKDKPYNKATYKETFLADLEELEKTGITHPDISKIRDMLKK